MSEPQQPFGHVSEPWPNQVGLAVYEPPSRTSYHTGDLRVDGYTGVPPLDAQVAALTARVAELERRLADLAREERA